MNSAKQEYGSRGRQGHKTVRKLWHGCHTISGYTQHPNVKTKGEDTAFIKYRKFIHWKKWGKARDSHISIPTFSHSPSYFI